MTSVKKSESPPPPQGSSERVLELLEQTAFECLPRLERPPTFLSEDQRAQYFLQQLASEFSELRSKVVDLEMEVSDFEESEDSQFGDLERELDEAANELDACLVDNNRLAAKVNDMAAILAKHGIQF
jgi:hypothetical protein